MNQQIQPDGIAHFRAALLLAAERGDNHLQVFTFPSEPLVHGWRACNQQRRP
jgi:hypothetical protein